MAAYDDLRQIKLTMETLQNTEERYRTIVETSYEGICISHENFQATFVNQRLTDIPPFKVMYDICEVMIENSLVNGHTIMRVD